MLANGEFTPIMPANVKEVKGIYLVDGVTLLDVSEKKKMYRKADNWCGERGGVIPSPKILYFIFFNLDTINALRVKIGQTPIPKKFVAWSSESIQLSKSVAAFNYALDMNSARIELLVSTSALIDDCDLANVICVAGEPRKVNNAM